MMRALAWAVTALTLAGGATFAFAQDASNPEQLKKLYGDALNQLKEAQDRKNELATRNEQLAAKVAELQKQLDEARNENLDLKRRDAEHAEKTFYLRSHHAAWQTFIDRYPELKSRWKKFLDSDVVASGNELPKLIDPEWPLTVTE